MQSSMKPKGLKTHQVYVENNLNAYVYSINSMFLYVTFVVLLSFLAVIGIAFINLVKDLLVGTRLLK
jgi:hypothetical protein